MENNKDINGFVGAMSMFLRMRIPTDIIIWIITLTVFTEEEKSCLIDTCIEINEEIKKEREETEKQSQKKGFLKKLFSK